jgi:prepilin signal peptidase PulO-like enzyme (type II secretory pathway)
MSSLKMYSIPGRFRRIENLHIVFWLLKDISWAMLWKPIGLAMFIPTIAVAVLITWQTRKLASELYHNLAIVCWITANGYWMIVEFFWPQFDYLRYYAAIPFSIGIFFILIYYFVILPAEKKNQKFVTITVEVSEKVLQIAKNE